MATLAIQTTARAGIDLTTLAVAAAGGGDAFANTGGQTLIVINGGGSPCVVTLVYGLGGKLDGQTVTPRTVSVAAGHTVEIGPFPQNLYNDVNGLMQITYSQVTTVTVAVRQLGT